MRKPPFLVKSRQSSKKPYSARRQWVVRLFGKWESSIRNLIYVLCGDLKYAYLEEGYYVCERGSCFFELYSSRAAKPTALALRAMLRLCRSARRATCARLADKRACRLSFAWLSASPLAVQATPHERQISPPPPKKKDTEARMDIPYLWRRRRDLNSRAGITDLHP